VVVTREAPTARGLLAWWRAMPGLSSGLLWYDLLGRTPGTLTNMGAGAGWAPTTRPGGQGEVRFDGSNDRVAVPVAPYLEPPAMTMMLWIKAVSWGASDVRALFTINAGGGVLREITVNTTGHLAVYLAATGGLALVDPAPTALAIGTWYHIAVTYDQVDGLRVYINCQPEATAAATGTLVVTNVAGAFGMNVTSFNRFFNGAMDDMRFYNRVVPRPELCTIMRDSQRGEPTLFRPPALILGLPTSTSAGAGAGGGFLPFFHTP